MAYNPVATGRQLDFNGLQNTTLWGEKVVLVPYAAIHVPKYHKWMESEEIRQLTASEPLTLTEEFDMQQKWMVDPDKLTFIVLSRELVNASSDGQVTENENAMIGDVNIFLSEVDEDEEEECDAAEQASGSIRKESISTSVSSSNNEPNKVSTKVTQLMGEIEIMIAEPSARGQGAGIEATAIMIHYAHSHLKLNRFQAKIGMDNERSIRMFERKFQFTFLSKSDVFKEVTLQLLLSDPAGSTYPAALNNLLDLSGNYDSKPVHSVKK